MNIDIGINIVKATEKKSNINFILKFFDLNFLKNDNKNSFMLPNNFVTPP